MCVCSVMAGSPSDVLHALYSVNLPHHTKYIFNTNIEMIGHASCNGFIGMNDVSDNIYCNKKDSRLYGRNGRLQYLPFPIPIFLCLVVCEHHLLKHVLCSKPHPAWPVQPVIFTRHFASIKG